jgi:hypothetical protein
MANATGKVIAGKDFDQISLASADGTLDVSGLSLNFTANYSPQLNDTITLITATKAVTGTLSAIALPANWHLVYETKAVKAIYDNQTSIPVDTKNNFNAYGIHNAIIVKKGFGSNISIQNALGQQLLRINASSDFEKITLKKGIYFVSNKTKTFKVIVK